jgi:hypothetical protein
MTTTLVHVVATVTAKRDRIADLQILLVELVSLTRQEKGCIQYELLQNKDDLSEFTFVETWASQADLDAHLASEHLKFAIGQLPELSIHEPDIRFYRLIV